MPTQFPEALDTFDNPRPDSSQSAVRTHSQQHGDANDSLEALQRKVGTNLSADPDSMDFKVGALENLTEGLGSAAFEPTDSFATAGQGGKADSAIQPPQLAAVQTQVDALAAGQQTSAIYAATLAELQVIVGAYDGQGAFVANGTGAGTYRWNAGASSWQFLRADMLVEKADKTDVVAGNRSLAQMGGAQTYGRASIGIGDGISAAGNTVVDRKGFTVAGQLAEIRVYARVAGSAQLKIVSRGNSGALDGAVVASYPVNLSVGVNRLRAGVDFPQVAVQAGWSWGIYTATGMLARQSGSSNLTMSVAGDVSGASTWVNTANAPQWQADLVTGPAVKETASKAGERANVALGAAVSTAVAGFALDGGTAFTNPNGTRIIHYALPLSLADLSL